MTLLLLALLPFAGAGVLAMVPNERRRAAASLAGAVTVTALALVIAAAPAVFEGQVLRWAVDWIPEFGVTFGFRMDGLAWMFALLVSAIGALVVLYAAYYLSADDPAARFFQYLLLFMGAMLGVVLADNLVLLVVFWEATSLASFLLIGYWNHRADAREGARMALTITGAGGLALLGGASRAGTCSRDRAWPIPRTGSFPSDCSPPRATFASISRPPSMPWSRCAPRSRKTRSPRVCSVPSARATGS